MHPVAARRYAGPFLLFFFASGFCALLYQTVWLKYLNLLFGNTTYATAAVLSAFMSGLTLGSWLAARFRFLLRVPLRFYGILEAGIGLFALLFPVLYSHFHSVSAFLFQLVGPESFSYNVLTFIVAFVVLVLPTSLMGATLPLLSHALVDRDHVSSGTGMLYALNTVGAVVGVLVSAFVLIPSFGLAATQYLGAITNLLIGSACILLAGSFAPPIAVMEPTSEKTPLIVYLYAISGLLAIGYEVVWTRILVLHLGSSVYAYAIMLAVFLVGISAGSYVSGRWIDRAGQAKAMVLFAGIQAAWAFGILLQVLQFVRFSDLLYFLARGAGITSPLQHFVVLFLATAAVLIVPTFLSGALFPAVVAASCEAGIDMTRAVSRSYSFNTMGGIFGSIVAAFALLPAAGTQGSLLLLAGGNLLIGLFLFIRRRILPAAALLVVFVGFALLINMHFSILRSAGIFRMEGKEQLVHLEEDYAAAVSVEKRVLYNQPYDSLSINGVNVAGTSPDLVAIQKLQGHVPMILFGPERPKSVLHIGFGSGGTAYSVSLYPNTSITVVELSRSVVRNADRYFRSVNHGIVQSGKLRFIYFDGRSYILNTAEKFDVILSDSIHPRYSGNGSLYTEDYYRLVRDRLNDGGIHSQWIPIYSLTAKNLKEILRAFADVFPETYVWYVNSNVNPYIIVTGRKEGAAGIPLENIREAFRYAPVAEDLRGINIGNEYFFVDNLLTGPDLLKHFVADSLPHTDDRLTVEYESSRIISRHSSWQDNFHQLLSLRRPAVPYLSAVERLDPVIYDRFYAATTANLEGQQFFLRGNRAKATQDFQKALAINPEDRDPNENRLLLH